jgi:SAM-dependent methyltransferase
MHTVSPTDNGRTLNWGKTSEDYAKFRSGQPDSFFDLIRAFGVGVKGQEILDLGTGTGVMALRYAQRGAQVTGIDISPEQISMAQKMAQEQRISAEFQVCAAERLSFAQHSFDVVTANQCWLYFKKDDVIRQVLWVLKEKGLLVTSHCSWLPLAEPLAEKSENLVREVNPDWSAYGWVGLVPAMPAWALGNFRLRGHFCYDEPIPFTRETWAGRIRACRGIGAALTKEQVADFDRRHMEMLQKEAPDKFTILHRIDAHILEPL